MSHFPIAAHPDVCLFQYGIHHNQLRDETQIEPPNFLAGLHYQRNKFADRAAVLHELSATLA
jgi:hypothetical protein